LQIITSASYFTGPCSKVIHATAGTYSTKKLIVSDRMRLAVKEMGVIREHLHVSFWDIDPSSWKQITKGT